MRYKQIVFDIDGTLLDTEDAVLHSLKEALVTVAGIKKETSELAFALGIPGKNALKQLQVKDIEAVFSYWEKSMAEHMDWVKVFDGIDSLLKKLQDSGYALGVVTSKTKNELEHDFKCFEIAGYFKTAICSSDTVEHKPNPEPLLKYMERTGCLANEMIYIGDSVYDMECAKGAGVDFVLAGWGTKNRYDGVLCADTPMDFLKMLS